MKKTIPELINFIDEEIAWRAKRAEMLKEKNLQVEEVEQLYENIKIFQIVLEQIK